MRFKIAAAKFSTISRIPKSHTSSTHTTNSHASSYDSVHTTPPSLHTAARYNRRESPGPCKHGDKCSCAALLLSLSRSYTEPLSNTYLPRGATAYSPPLRVCQSLLASRTGGFLCLAMQRRMMKPQGRPLIRTRGQKRPLFYRRSLMSSLQLTDAG